jgi:glycosyltransferase involved in cell wall biosynthesis
MTSNSFPIISIIVPCYNQEHYIAECLDSVILQTYKNWECIVIDDGSIDNTKMIVEKFTKIDSRITYYYQANSGVCVARNIAIAKSKGKYILPLDGDDKIGNTYIEKAVTLMQNDENLSVVYCNAEYFGQRTGKWILPPYSFKMLLSKNILFSSCVFRKVNFDKTNGYDVNMRTGLEDWEFWIALLNDKSKVFCINELLFFYRINTNSRNHSFNAKSRKDIRAYIYNKHQALYHQYFNVLELLSEISYLKNENRGLLNSRKYKLGSKIVSLFKPINFLFEKRSH